MCIKFWKVKYTSCNCSLTVHFTSRKTLWTTKRHSALQRSHKYIVLTLVNSHLLSGSNISQSCQRGSFSNQLSCGIVLGPLQLFRSLVLYSCNLMWLQCQISIFLFKLNLWIQVNYKIVNLKNKIHHKMHVLQGLCGKALICFSLSTGSV